MPFQHDLQEIRFQDMPEFKEGFVKRYSLLTNWDDFKKYSLSYLNRCIRIGNKMPIAVVKKGLESKGWILEKVPWMENAFWVRHEEGRLDLGSTIEHQLGYFYIQEAASMIPPLALDPKPGELVLDMCSAPGSKTTQIAEMMHNQGLVVANDVNGLRLAPLGVNIQRMGVYNVIQTQRDSARLRWNVQFDKILLDAPCSGVGTIRKSIKTIGMWNPKMINHIASLQRKLINVAWGLLKPGGILVYSTCSTEPEEDEEIISNFLEKNADADVLPFDLPGFKRSPAVTEFEGKVYDKRVEHTLRVWPQDNDTEGFYVAKLVKKA
ncbi:MAG: NOL1/NOP2/sun family putative RNA methylase [Candidatus Woesearchaeota archaeon]